MTDPSDNDTLQFRAKLHRRASKGQPLRDDEIDYITKKSEELGEATTEATGMFNDFLFLTSSRRH